MNAKWIVALPNNSANTKIIHTNNLIACSWYHCPVQISNMSLCLIIIIIIYDNIKLSQSSQ